MSCPAVWKNEFETSPFSFVQGHFGPLLGPVDSIGKKADSKHHEPLAKPMGAALNTSSKSQALDMHQISPNDAISSSKEEEEDDP